MNIFDMFWLLLFGIGGALVGSQIAGATGAAFGFVAGLALLFVLGNLLSRQLLHLPPCQCGARWKTLIHEREPTWGLVHRCGSCGHVLILRRGSAIDIVKDDTTIPYMRRTFFGGWKPVVRSQGGD